MSADAFSERHIDALKSTLADRLSAGGKRFEHRPLSMDAQQAIDDLIFAIGVVRDEGRAIHLIRRFIPILLAKGLFAETEI